MTKGERGTQPDLGELSGRRFEAVIFDMDGTLIDSTAAVMRAWSKWADEHDLSRSHLGKHHGMPSASVVRLLLPETHRHSSAIDRINELELDDVAGIVVLPGAAEALHALSHAKAAIATSCTIPLAEARISAAQLDPPAVLITADQVRRGKPAPDPFLEAARRLGADPAHCLVVEDAPSGLQAAHAAGCATLAVVTTTPRERLHADAIVPDLSHVRFEVADDRIRVVPA